MTDYSTWTYKLGDLLTKTKGSSWTGHVVGFYGTGLTDEGYAIESINEPGSVQIYPVSALRRADLNEQTFRTVMLEAEVARLKALLDERDKFIVSRDLWGAFTDALAGKGEKP